MTAYYNEIDPQAAAWLRELIKRGLIADGDVDERSIEDVLPDDLRRYTQCHFFAGIGVWSYALRQAGWPDDRPVWTGSCPCQPFSSAGKGKGFDDERHLWPAFHWLIKQCRPDIVLGEQVASKGGRTWLDLVSTDLEGEGYSCGSASTVACGFGAPHKRQRLYWVADGKSQRLERHTDHGGYGKRDQAQGRAGGGGFSGQPYSVADTSSESCEWDTGRVFGTQEAGCSERVKNGSCAHGYPDGCEACGVAQSYSGECQRESEGQRCQPNGKKAGWKQSNCCSSWDSAAHSTGNPGPTNGFWRDADWLFCRDEKWRAVRSGTFPLVDGAPARVVRLRGYGNAIVSKQAQAFIEAVMEAI